MSSDTYETQINDIWTGSCVYLASMAILYYDHLVTLSREIDAFWSRPNSLNSALFFFNRYFAFSSNIALAILATAGYDEKRCYAFRLFQQIHSFIAEAIICDIMMLRIYALYAGNRRIVYVFILCALVLGTIGVWALTGQKTIPQPQSSIIGCTRSQSEETYGRISISWLTVLAFDTLMTTLAVWQCYQNGSYKLRHRRPLPWLIARDNILYFVVIEVVNIANIILMHVGRPFFRSLLNTPKVNLSTVVTSRLLLNLNEHSDVGLSPPAPTQGSKVHHDLSFVPGSERTGNIHLTDLYEMTEPVEEPRWGV